MTKYISAAIVTIFSFAPEVQGQAPPPPPPPPAVGIFLGNPLATTISYAPAVHGAAAPIPGSQAQYRALQPHWINQHYFNVGEILTEPSIDGPGNIPAGWMPTLAVDPLNAAAVTAFYNAGPRAGSYEDLAQWANSQWTNVSPSTIVRPVTFWKQKGEQWFLTGLGSAMPPWST